MQRTALQRTYCHWAPNTSACSPACRGGARRAPLRWLPRRGSWLGAAAFCCVSYVFAAAAAAVHPARCLAWQQLGQARAPLAAASALGAWLHRDPTSPCTQQQEPAEAPPCMWCATRHARPRTYCVAARAFGTGGVPRRQQRAAAAIGAPVCAGREQAMRAAHATRPAITGPTLASGSSSSTAWMARRPATEGVLRAAATNGACPLTQAVAHRQRNLEARGSLVPSWCALQLWGSTLLLQLAVSPRAPPQPGSVAAQHGGMPRHSVAAAFPPAHFPCRKVLSM
jgi:hypothetical protein